MASKTVFLEHTADVLFESSGASFEEALENAAQALFETIADPSKVRGSNSLDVAVHAVSLEELAVATLSRLLSEEDANEWFFKSFRVTEFAKTTRGYSLKGIVEGGDANREAGRMTVKAVTHHETRVTQEGNSWKIRILLDI
ncbi:TPA: archease [Candidatus Micrarchaeota archaeon]|nr:MAG: hypothetical protein AUJ65_02970 [Candidatus Micrarchaeota archaeon CG1_02_51_15]HII38908.1 archease [Candidatus Micrarchaeota archaeon]